MNYPTKEGDYRKFGAVVKQGEIVFTFEGEKEDECFVLLYGKKNELAARIAVPAEYCIGSLRSISVLGLSAGSLKYNYEINGHVITDVHASRIIGREKWNDCRRREDGYQIYGGCVLDEFDWGKDQMPEIPRHEMLLYKLHVRGFSMDAGLTGKKRGTFAAAMERIPYLKKLGVTTVEFMPIHEFEEILYDKREENTAYIDWESQENDLIKPAAAPTEERLNYWGYGPGNYFAVKASYGSTADASSEWKELVRTLHENHMECVMEMYFPDGMNQNVILDSLRYWVREYHVDGFHLLGNAIPVTVAAQDLWLSRTKLFYTGFDPALGETRRNYKRLFVYRDEYLYPVRKLLNHMGGDIEELVCQQRKQHQEIGFVNYICGNNGFTLYDLFSYGEKHNEKNGEDNRDGNDWNYSSNCGVEGKTAKKRINGLRERQIRNAIATLMLGQGVPLVMAGDEMGNTQEGNNNAYCQDNRIGWINWRRAAKYEWIAGFLAELGRFRRKHPILTSETPMQLNDYGQKGFPDLSYHGENAWISHFQRERQTVGMMYCGLYARREDGKPDDFVYVGYNFQPGMGRLALPKLPGRKNWYLTMDTSLGRESFLPQEEKIKEQQFAIHGQSVVILLGK